MSNNGSPETGQHLRALRDEWRHRLRAKKPNYYCPQCSSICFLDQDECIGCGADKPSSSWPELSDGADPWLGEVVQDRYIIARPLAAGASGQVYRAESLSISRQFAIKIISTDGRQKQADQVLARLQLEIEALSRLRNPHIVSIYELVELDRTFVAAVMDLIEGQTLEELVTRGEPLSISRAAMLLRQTANGIYGAHQAGMIHRDLKPDNIMVERLPVGDDFVHILDFGIVRLTDEPAVGLTQGFIGTPLYASPEQAMAKPIDHRSDIYSLGAILFFMLTGRPPFVSDKVYEVLRMHVKQSPPRLSKAAQGREFPLKLEDLTRRMLAKDPADRPHDLSQVIDELDRFVRSQISEAEDDTTSTNPHPPVAPSSTQTRPLTPISGVPKATTGSDDGAFVGDDHTSAATLKALGERPPAHTPPFLRSPTPIDTAPLESQLSAGMTSIFNPAEMGAEHSEARAIPVPTYRLQSAPSKTVATGIVDDRFAIFDRQADQIVFFDAQASSPSTLSLSDGQTISALALSRHHLVVGHDNGTISQTRIQTEASKSLFQDIRRAPITSVAVDRERQIIVAGSQSGRVYIHHRGNKKSTSDWKRIRNGEAVTSIALNEATGTIVIARQNRRVEIVAVSKPRTASSQFKIDIPIHSLAISSDDYLLATALADGSLALYEAPTGRQLLRLPGGPLDILSVHFSDQGQPVVTCAIDKQVHLIQFEQVAAHR